VIMARSYRPSRRPRRPISTPPLRLPIDHGLRPSQRSEIICAINKR
jgi:hypothetical protein